MERLTKRVGKHTVIIGCPNFALPKIAGLIIQQAVDRLAAIEDILGDEYDLDRLRELKQADDEVRHGRWILSRRQAASAIFKCSECGREELFDAYHRLENTPYCHCGARMDKDPTCEQE